jgi:hypothetical protein
MWNHSSAAAFAVARRMNIVSAISQKSPHDCGGAMLMYLPPPTDSETASINAQQLAAHLDLLFSGCSGFVALRAVSHQKKTVKLRITK